MSDKPETAAPGAGGKRPVQILRERRGGVPGELMERNRRHGVIRRKILAALKKEPMTVPELARAVELPTHEVFWHVVGMKKYGKVAESEQVDGYFKYELVDQSRQAESTS